MNKNGRSAKPEIEGLPDIDDSWTIPKDHLTLKHEIGKGAFGTVYKADYLGIDVAVKTISQGGPNADPMEKTFAEREIAVFKKVAVIPMWWLLLGSWRMIKGKGYRLYWSIYRRVT